MTTVSLCYAILALVTASVPTPEPREAKADQTVKSTPVTITATIEAIDQTNRIVTLKGRKGTWSTPTWMRATSGSTSSRSAIR